jgi:hypothetical protein
MGAHVLGQAEGLCGPLDVLPNGLPGLVLAVLGPWKGPIPARLGQDLSPQAIGQADLPPLAGLGLGNDELPPQLLPFEGYHVPYT